MGMETAGLHRNEHVWCPGGSGQGRVSPWMEIPGIPFRPVHCRKTQRGGVWRLQYGPPVHVCVMSERGNMCHIEEGTCPWFWWLSYCPGLSRVGDLSWPLPRGDTVCPARWHCPGLANIAHIGRSVDFPVIARVFFFRSVGQNHPSLARPRPRQFFPRPASHRGQPSWLGALAGLREREAGGIVFVPGMWIERGGDLQSTMALRRDAATAAKRGGTRARLG
eukprot:gene22438-biopygen7205